MLRQERPSTEKSGVELGLAVAGGKLERLDFTLTGAVAADDFYLAFFGAYRSLFEKKNIWQLAGLGFREWESYWRDRNHLALFQNDELARAQLLYQASLKLFLNELWGQMWPQTAYPSAAP